ncbi:MAG: helix-turn-helix transcriptional regulator [Desulfarculus sp.]|nr:helix-turn-helix transcriptional regulator [Desulfarculus sp.]
MLTSDDIWAELRRRRIRAKDIARALGVAVSTVTRAINGETRTPAPDLMDHIASEIGVPAEQLAPNLPHPQPSAQTACPRG